jgi:hypothetical protein
VSREIRRVPVGWQHPTEPDPYYQEREDRLRLAEMMGWNPDRTPPSRLVKPGERFVALLSPSLSVQQREWDNGLAEWLAGTHESFDFHLKYHHKDGYVDRDGERSFNPLRIYADDGETVLREWFIESADDLKTEGAYIACRWERPSDDRAGDYMPDFDAPEDQLGWCLYQTVSEGTPVTPVFATPEDLIDYLATVGQDHDEEPMRRASAEAVVRTGYTLGSMLVTDGQVLRSDMDADRIEALGIATS